MTGAGRVHECRAARPLRPAWGQLVPPLKVAARRGRASIEGRVRRRITRGRSRHEVRELEYGRRGQREPDRVIPLPAPTVCFAPPAIDPRVSVLQAVAA